jgi:predicted PurR-regulated permease PerM
MEAQLLGRGEVTIRYFVYTLVVTILIAYVGAVTLRPGANYLEVFRVIGTAGILAYAAGTFGWLWPK